MTAVAAVGRGAAPCVGDDSTRRAKAA